MLKDILVHVPSERPAGPVIDGAISLAKSRASRIQAVSAGFESANVGVSGGVAIGAVFEIEHERARQRADAALSVFEAEARKAGLAYELTALTGTPYDANARISAMARLTDLAVVLQPDYQSDTFDNEVPVDVLFECGGPVLFIPYTHKGPLALNRIGIAWDGSRLAARALRDATPFLNTAQNIFLISVNESSKSKNPTAADLVGHLTRCGFNSKVEHTTADGSDVQPAILSIAADIGLDLIVMGAYGHSRLQERLLGGVTRNMLESMTVPTLMSH